jgi:hypothetical protein
MESMIGILGPSMMAGLWVLAGFIVSLEMLEMFRDVTQRRY